MCRTRAAANLVRNIQQGRLKFTHKGREERAAEPHGVPLTLVRDDFDVDTRRLDRRVRRGGYVQDVLAYPQRAAACSCIGFQPTVDDELQVTLQPVPEMLEHRRPAGEHDVLM